MLGDAGVYVWALLVCNICTAILRITGTHVEYLYKINGQQQSYNNGGLLPYVPSTVDRFHRSEELAD